MSRYGHMLKVCTFFTCMRVHCGQVGPQNSLAGLANITQIEAQHPHTTVLHLHMLGVELQGLLSLPVSIQIGNQSCSVSWVVSKVLLVPQVCRLCS